jgi:hypothetical protein
VQFEVAAAEGTQGDLAGLGGRNMATFHGLAAALKEADNIGR